MSADADIYLGLAFIFLSVFQYFFAMFVVFSYKYSMSPVRQLASIRFISFN